MTVARTIFAFTGLEALTQLALFATIGAFYIPPMWGHGRREPENSIYRQEQKSRRQLLIGGGGIVSILSGTSGLPLTLN